MKMKLLLIVVLVPLALCVASLFFFRHDHRRVGSYVSVSNVRKFFDRDNPMDANSLVEFVMISKCLENGQIDRAREILNLLMDYEVVDAQGMANALSNTDSEARKRVEKALVFAAQHRVEFPREARSIPADSLSIDQPEAVQSRADDILRIYQ